MNLFIAFFWWFCGSILFSRYLIPVVFRLVDESEMIGHGVPSIRASKRGVWWRVEKRSQKKGEVAEMRKGWDRLEVVEHVLWQFEASHPDVGKSGFLLGRVLEFQDVKTTYFRSFQAQFPWVLSETFGISKTWAKLAKSWNPWNYFAMAGHVEPRWTQKNLKNAAKMDGAVAAQTRAHLGSSSMHCESSWNITNCGRAMFIIHHNYRYTIHTCRVQKL